MAVSAAISKTYTFNRHLEVAAARIRFAATECFMLDLILLAFGLALFVVSLGYAYACDRL
jgi:hypothetical protein